MKIWQRTWSEATNLLFLLSSAAFCPSLSLSLPLSFAVLSSKVSSLQEQQQRRRRQALFPFIATYRLWHSVLPSLVSMITWFAGSIKAVYICIYLSRCISIGRGISGSTDVRRRNNNFHRCHVEKKARRTTLVHLREISYAHVISLVVWFFKRTSPSYMRDRCLVARKTAYIHPYRSSWSEGWERVRKGKENEGETERNNKSVCINQAGITA